MGDGSKTGYMLGRALRFEQAGKNVSLMEWKVEVVKFHGQRGHESSWREDPNAPQTPIPSRA